LVKGGKAPPAVSQTLEFALVFLTGQFAVLRLNSKLEVGQASTPKNLLLNGTGLAFRRFTFFESS
jgi:hypothetical protein